MQLIPNWQNAYKFSSNIIMAVLGVFDVIYANYASFQGIMTPGQFATLNTVMATAAIIARIIKQSLPVTPEVKQQMVDHVEALPEKGFPNGF